MGGLAKFGVAFLVLFLALAWGGCAGKQPTEEDKVLLDMTGQMADLAEKDLGVVMAFVRGPHGLPVPEEVLVAGARLETTVKDAKASTAVLTKVLGAPEKRTPYTPEAAAAARTASEKSHEGGFWGMVGAAAIGVGGALWGLGRKFGHLLPVVGPIFGVADTLMGGIEAAMAKFKAKGNAEALDDLKEMVVALQKKDPRIKAWVDRNLERVKQKFGPEIAKILEEGLAEESPPPTPPSPTASKPIDPLDGVIPAS